MIRNDLFRNVYLCYGDSRKVTIDSNRILRFLPGQGSSLHLLVSELVVPSMVQSSPPCILVGLSQFLVLVWLAPPHVTGHDSHAFQLPHPPLTFERSKKLTLIYFYCENCDWTISGKLLKCYEIPNI